MAIGLDEDFHPITGLEMNSRASFGKMICPFEVTLASIAGPYF
ncbi:MAG: hypothetical protein WBQ17_08875 [Rhizomicrobium sp.]